MNGTRINSLCFRRRYRVWGSWRDSLLGRARRGDRERRGLWSGAIRGGLGRDALLIASELCELRTRAVFVLNSRCGLVMKGERRVARSLKGGTAILWSPSRAVLIQVRPGLNARCIHEHGTSSDQLTLAETFEGPYRLVGCVAQKWGFGRSASLPIRCVVVPRLARSGNPIVG